ncbi:MAG: hypothetical protein IJJ77_08105 [Paludibacteraceae bacterium]|jgi:hypothetical protein|nr:hypothetical protein [Paludibacteraceae bacterium]
MKKCYINPQIIVVPIRPRPVMLETSDVNGGGSADPTKPFDDAKGFYGSWEEDEE